MSSCGSNDAPAAFSHKNNWLIMSTVMSRWSSMFFCFFSCVNCCLCHMQKLLSNLGWEIIYSFWFRDLGDMTSGLHLNKPVHHTKAAKNNKQWHTQFYVLNCLNLQLCLYIIRDKEKKKHCKNMNSRFLCY